MSDSNPQCSFGATQKCPTFSHDCPPPSHPPEFYLPFLPVAPHHPHKRPLPICLVSPSINPKGHCCPHLPTFLSNPLLLLRVHHSTRLVRFSSAAALTFPVFWGLFQERTQINECERVNLNEAKCTLLYVMNSQLAGAEVIQSSQLMFSAPDLFKMSHKKSSGITECTTCDRENFLGSYAKRYKIFWLSILAQCAILSGISCKEEINYL